MSEPGSGSGWVKPVGIGCLVLVILAVGAGIFIAMNAKQFGGMVMEKVATEAIDEIPLPEDERRDLQELIGELSDDFRSGALTLEEFEAIMEEMGSDPVLTVGALVHGFRVDTLEKLDLTADEREAARLTCMRFARGLAEDRLPARVVGRIQSDLSRYVEHGETPTRADAEDTLAEMAEAADAAEIPAEPYEIDFSGVARAAIDRARGY